MKEHKTRWRKGEKTLEKWLKGGKNTRGFTIEGKRQRKKKGEIRESIVKVSNTHLQNLLIPKKRQPQGQISHWFDLKGEERTRTLKKKKKRDTRGVRLSILIRGKWGLTCLYGWRRAPQGFFA